MDKEEYEDFEYILFGIIADLGQLARAKSRNDKPGYKINLNQLTKKFTKLGEYA